MLHETTHLAVRVAFVKERIFQPLFHKVFLITMDCNGQYIRLNLHPYQCFLGCVKFADFTSHTRMTIDEKKYVFKNMCEIGMKAYTVVAIVL